LLYSRAARPRRPAPTIPAAPTAWVGAMPADDAEAVALAAMLLADPVSDATTLEALLPTEAATLLAEESAELATLSAELKADEPAVLALESKLAMLELTLASLELSDAETEAAKLEADEVMLLIADVADDVTEERTLAAVEREDEMEEADELSWALTPAKAAMARMRALENCMVND